MTHTPNTRRPLLRRLLEDEGGFLGLGVWGLTALFGSLFAGTASNIYATKRSGAINDRSLGVSESALAQDERVATADREFQAEQARLDREYQERIRQEELAFNQSRWDDYIMASSPYWSLGQSAAGGLANLAGVPFAAGALPQVGSTPGRGGGGPRAGVFEPSGSPNVVPPGTNSLASLGGLTGTSSPTGGRGASFAQQPIQLPQQDGLKQIMGLMQLAGMGGSGQSDLRWQGPSLRNV